MSEKKYIFFDIDGTILPADAIIPESTIKALSLAQKNGHEIFLNTGRSKPIIPKTLLNLNFDGLICGTGTFAEYKGKPMFKNVYNQDQTNRIIDLSLKYDIPVIMSTNTECVATSSDAAKFIAMFTEGEFDESQFKSAEDITKSPLLDSMRPFIVDDDKTNFYKNYTDISDFVYIDSPFNVEKVNSMIGEDLNAEKASFKVPDDYSGEITMTAYTKSTGIKNLLDLIGADMKDSIAVGDGYNDVEMLKAANLSIAMGNAPDDVKQIADYVTDDIKSDGVSNALKHFKII